ncbi:DUF4113 domain-containing protein [Cronobacter dublinensis]
MWDDFFSQGVAQLNLFDENAPRANSEALMSLMDKLNQQGWGTFYFAGQGIQQSWQIKREMLSPVTRRDSLMYRPCGHSKRDIVQAIKRSEGPL